MIRVRARSGVRKSGLEFVSIFQAVAPRIGSGWLRRWRFFFRPSGLDNVFYLTHSLRCGMYSFAASRLGFGCP